jgi:hypothetical protein
MASSSPIRASTAILLLVESVAMLIRWLFKDRLSAHGEPGERRANQTGPVDRPGA